MNASLDDVVTPEVLVAGAGPTGLSLAADLVRRGVRVRIIDKKEGPEPFWKAGNLWPRTLEHLSRLPNDFLSGLEAKSLHVRAVHAHGFGRHLAEIPGDRYDKSPFNAAFLNGQNVIETALRDHLAAAGVAVEYGLSLKTVHDRGDHVEAVCERESGATETVRALYLAGCEGARSVARDAAGLAFDPPAQKGAQMLIADVRLSWARPTSPDIMWIFLYGNGYAGIAPQSGGVHHIWFFDSVETLQRYDPTAEQIEARLREVVGDPSVRVEEGLWFSHIAEPRTGVAAGLRRGRIFLVGDAGHVSLPVGGQGMNSGIQDAFNLGWKLAAVLRGQADPGLLDSYEAERLEIRRELSEDQIKGMRRMLHPGTLQKFAMRAIAPWLARTGGATEFAGERDAAMLDIAYSNSPLIEDRLGRGGVRSGERGPEAVLARAGGETFRLFDAFYGLDGWALLAFDGGERDSDEAEAARAAAVAAGQAMAAIGGRAYAILSVAPPAPVEDPASQPDVLYDLDRTAHGAYGLTGRPAFVLVRPDGYVAYRGPIRADEALTTYLDRIATGG